MKFIVLSFLLLLLGCSGGSNSPAPESPIIVKLSKNLDYGSISGDLSCPQGCSEVEKEVRGSITLSAEPLPGYTLSTWGIPSCGSDLTCVIEVNKSLNIFVVFEPLVVEEDSREVISQIESYPRSDNTLTAYKQSLEVRFFGKNANFINFYEDKNCEEIQATESLFLGYRIEQDSVLATDVIDYYVENGENFKFKYYYKYQNEDSQLTSDCLSLEVELPVEHYAGESSAEFISNNSSSYSDFEVLEHINGSNFSLLRVKENNVDLLFKIDASGQLYKVEYEGEFLILHSNKMFENQGRIIFIGKKSSDSIWSLFSLGSTIMKSSVSFNEGFSYVFDNKLVLAVQDGVGNYELRYYSIDSSLFLILGSSLGSFSTSLAGLDNSVSLNSTTILIPYEINGVNNGLLKLTQGNLEWIISPGIGISNQEQSIIKVSGGVLVTSFGASDQFDVHYINENGVVSKISNPILSKFRQVNGSIFEDMNIVFLNDYVLSCNDYLKCGISEISNNNLTVLKDSVSLKNIQKSDNNGLKLVDLKNSMKSSYFDYDTIVVNPNKNMFWSYQNDYKKTNDYINKSGVVFQTLMDGYVRHISPEEKRVYKLECPTSGGRRSQYINDLGLNHSSWFFGDYLIVNGPDCSPSATMDKKSLYILKLY